MRLGSGPHFIPWGLMQLSTRSRLVQEFQCPGEPEKVFRGHDSDPLPSEGMVRPIRVVTRAPEKEDTGILDAQMTLIVSFVVQYVIGDVLNFNSNFGSTQQVESQVRDIGEVIIAEAASATTPAGFIKKLPEINASLITAMEDRLDHSGIEIISVRMISPDVSREVSAALAGIPVASAKAQARIIAATANETELAKEGAGKASAEQAMLVAKAAGRKKMATELNVAGSEILAAETANSLVNANTVIVGANSGMQELMGAVTAIRTTLQQPQPKGDTK